MFLPVFLRQWFKVKGSSGNVADVTAGGKVKVEAELTATDFPDIALSTKIGEVSATPTVNTVLERLKTVKAGIDVVVDGVGPRIGESGAHSTIGFLAEIEGAIDQNRYMRSLPNADPANITIALASLAIGVARQSTVISNPNGYRTALIHLRIQSGAVAPTAGALYEIYLIRGYAGMRDDNAGETDSGIILENTPLLGTIVVTATANKNFYGIFDTAFLGELGTSFAIAVKNSSGQVLNDTEANHIKTCVMFGTVRV